MKPFFINNQNNILSFDCLMLMLQVIKMLVLIVVIFIVCWAPILILDLLTAFHVFQEHATGTLKHIKTTFHLMSYFNRQVNFVYFKSLKCLRHFIQKITKVMVEKHDGRVWNPWKGQNFSAIDLFSTTNVYCSYSIIHNNLTTITLTLSCFFKLRLNKPKRKNSTKMLFNAKCHY